jgi:NTP pyrophosphatase (non-canonical NTP hydrolase)
MNDKSLESLRVALRKFAADRDWDQFHSPKNLAAALVVESAELLEHFQWLKDEESATLSASKLEQVSHELADVLLYLVRMADKLDVDLIDAAREKMKINESKYPASITRGSNKKYTEF